MVPKAELFERIEQSFVLFKKYICQIGLPLVILYVLFVIFGQLFTSLVVSRIPVNDALMSNPASIFTQSSFVMMISIGLVGFLIYSIFAIVFQLATLFGIKNAFEGKKIELGECLVYGSKNLLNSFTTYWNIFLYVYMIPALLLIVGLVLVLNGQLGSNNGFLEMGFILIGVSFLVLMVFAIVRGLRTKFALCSAVDADSFTRVNFKKSIGYTKNNWWRILGNIVLVAILLTFLNWAVQMFTGLFNSVAGPENPLMHFNLPEGDGEITPAMSNEMATTIKDTLEYITDFHLVSFIIAMISGIANALFAAFGITFIYIFFKRLELEGEDVEIKNVTEMKHEENSKEIKRGQIEEL